jgi:hypothetical protein
VELVGVRADVASILLVLSRTGSLAPKMVGLRNCVRQHRGPRMYAGLISVVWAGINSRL